MRSRPPFLAALLLSAVALLPAAHAQDQSTAWPVRPIKIVIGFAPGGSTDTPMRVLAESASKLLKQPVIIENKPGAGASMGVMDMKTAVPDVRGKSSSARSFRKTSAGICIRA